MLNDSCWEFLNIYTSIFQSNPKWTYIESLKFHSRKEISSKNLCSFFPAKMLTLINLYKKRASARTCSIITVFKNGWHSRTQKTYVTGFSRFCPIILYFIKNKKRFYKRNSQEIDQPEKVLCADQNGNTKITTITRKYVVLILSPLHDCLFHNSIRNKKNLTSLNCKKQCKNLKLQKSNPAYRKLQKCRKNSAENKSQFFSVFLIYSQPVKEPGNRWNFRLIVLPVSIINLSTFRRVTQVPSIVTKIFFLILRIRRKGRLCFRLKNVKIRESKNLRHLPPGVKHHHSRQLRETVQSSLQIQHSAEVYIKNSLERILGNNSKKKWWSH